MKGLFVLMLRVRGCPEVSGGALFYGAIFFRTIKKAGTEDLPISIGTRTRPNKNIFYEGSLGFNPPIFSTLFYLKA